MNLIFLIVSFMLDEKCYSIKSIDEARIYLLSYKRSVDDFDYQLQTNFGYVYNLSNGEVCFLPNSLHGEHKGIIFNSQVCFDEYINGDILPLENPHKLVFEKYSLQMQNMNSLLNTALSKLNYIERYSSENPELSLKEILFDIRAQRKKYGQDEKFMCSIILGEYLRITMNGRWLLLKQYGQYNPYFIPAIEYPNQNFVPLLDRIQDLLNYDEISFDDFMHLDDIKSPKHSRANTYAYEWILK